jgi:hypothetical protein
LDNETVLSENPITVSVLDEFGNVIYEVVSGDEFTEDQALQIVLDWMRKDES